MNKTEVANNVSWGISLVFVGVLFLLDNLGIVNGNLNNWWAIFILMPGINLLYASIKTKLNGKRNNLLSNSSFIIGIALILFSLSFLINLKLDYLLPIIVIGLGINLLIQKEVV